MAANFQLVRMPTGSYAAQFANGQIVPLNMSSDGWGRTVDQFGNVYQQQLPWQGGVPAGSSPGNGIGMQAPQVAQPAWAAPQGAGSNVQPGYGAVLNPDNFASMYNISEGQAYRRPVYPTMPLFFKGGAKMTRILGTSLVPSDPDYAVNGLINRIIRFDLPSIAFDINGWSFNTSPGNAFPVGVDPNGAYRLQVKFGQQENLSSDVRLAKSFVGTGERPGQIGGDGWIMDSGANMILVIQPLLPGLIIDISVKVIEARGLANFTVPG